jgi:hypothetical protein
VNAVGRSILSLRKRARAAESTLQRKAKGNPTMPATVPRPDRGWRRALVKQQSLTTEATEFAEKPHGQAQSSAAGWRGMRRDSTGVNCLFWGIRSATISAPFL